MTALYRANKKLNASKYAKCTHKETSVLDYIPLDSTRLVLIRLDVTRLDYKEPLHALYAVNGRCKKYPKGGTLFHTAFEGAWPWAQHFRLHFCNTFLMNVFCHPSIQDEHLVYPPIKKNLQKVFMCFVKVLHYQKT